MEQIFLLKNAPFEPVIVQRYFKHYFVPNTSRFYDSTFVKYTCKESRVLCKETYNFRVVDFYFCIL